MKTYSPLVPGMVKLEGMLGGALDRIEKNRFLKMDWTHLVEPFRLRNENDGFWRCEFWGKIVRSAILTWRSTGNPELLRRIDDTVTELLSTQTPDGCVSTYPEERQLLKWDIWGRKYVLLALLRYLRDVHEDEHILSACRRMADRLIEQTAGRPLNAFGEHEGLAACSILNAFVQLYSASGESGHLDFAKNIILCGCSRRHNIFEAAERLVPPSETGNGKAYEMMSCFEGLAEYNAVAPEPLYPSAPENFYRLMRGHEIFITGTAGLKDGCGEFDYDGRFKQTRTDSGALGETCITATWLHYCEHMLLLKGLDEAASEAERSFCNAAAGAVQNDGAWFCHVNPTPLSDFAPKIPARNQIPGFGEDCCAAQGPEAVALAPYLAVLKSPDGYLVNLYEDMTVAGLFRLRGGYPFGGKVSLEMLLPEPETFTLSLRIPEWWNEKCSLCVCGGTVQAVRGKTASIRREWKGGDAVALEFDLSVRRVEAPGDPSSEAFLSGPLVLVQSTRLPRSEFPLPDSAVFTDSAPRGGLTCVKEVSCGGAFCDYASAGNSFEDNDRLRVWFPRRLPERYVYKRDR